MAKSGSLPRGESLSKAWRLGCQLGIFIKETHQAGMARIMSSQVLRNWQLGCVDSTFPLVVEGECDGFVVSPPLNTVFGGEVRL
eukprot:scaffold873_cov111-Isochrysis_galbana.AAC.7